MRGKWIFGVASAAILAGMGLAHSASAQSAAASAADPAGDNSTRARVAPGETVNGSIGQGGDLDWYRISMRTGQLYRISLNGAEGDGALSDPKLRIVNAHGEELAANDDHEGL